MKRAKKAKRFFFIAACQGGCCDQAHVVELTIKAGNLDAAYEKAEKKLGKRWAVGDLFAVQKLPVEA